MTPRRFYLSQKAREWALACVCLAPWFVGFMVLHLGAMVYSLALGFFQADMLTHVRFIGLANYRELARDQFFLKSLSVTARYALAAVPLGVTFSLVVALMLNEQLPVQGLWRTLYYLPSVVTGIAVAILWGWMFNPKIGIINAGLGLLGIEGPMWLASERWALPALVIMSLWGVGHNMLLYLAALQGVPTALYDAAKIDGANALRRFWHVTLAMISPTIFFTSVMGIIGAFQFFVEPYVMTQGGPNNATLSVVLYIYRRSFEQLRFGYASALAWVLFMVIMMCTLLVFKSSGLWVYYEAELRK